MPTLEAVMIVAKNGNGQLGAQGDSQHHPAMTRSKAQEILSTDRFFIPKNFEIQVIEGASYVEDEKGVIYNAQTGEPIRPKI